MDTADVTKGIFFIIQLGFGVWGNVAIMLSYLYLEATEHVLKPIDLTVMHLALVNLTSLVFSGIPEIIFLFGVKEIFTNAGCKAVVYIHRVARAVSVTTTCTLSVFQSVTVAPVTSCWGNMKLAFPKFLIPSFLFFWIVNGVSNTYMLIYMSALQNNTLPENSVNLGFCYFPYFKKLHIEAILSRIFTVANDLFPMLVMVLASGHILLTLRRHQKQVKYIKGSSTNHIKTTEEQAANTIIKLVTLYIFFYGVDTGILMYTTATRRQDLFLSHVQTFCACCYPALSPIITSSLNKKISYASIFCARRTVH